MVGVGVPAAWRGVLFSVGWGEQVSRSEREREKKRKDQFAQYEEPCCGIPKFRITPIAQ